MLGEAHAQVGGADPEAPGAAQTPPPATAETKPGGKGLSEDEKAILAVDDAFTSRYNKGDGKALMALFAEDAEVIEAEGDRYKGARRSRRASPTPSPPAPAQGRVRDRVDPLHQPGGRA